MKSTISKPKVSISSFLSHFADRITFDALATWAGEAVFQRGHAYYKDGKVDNIALTPDGRLLATVSGTRKYSTLFFQKSDGKIDSLCTCPYGLACKHAVALACACLALLAEKQTIPLAADNDKRLLDLKMAFSDGARQAEIAPSPQELEEILKTFSQKELITLMLQATQIAPEVATLCLGKAKPQRKSVLAMVEDARTAMYKATQTLDWDDYYQDVPDYESVRKKLEVLRVAGFPAEVLELGFELIDDSQDQIEMCDDDGRIHDDVAECMGSVLRALRDVDWPMHKKLLWAVDAVLNDEFAICECFWEILHEMHSAADWNPVADALLARLACCQKADYARQRLMNMTLHSLAAAGREAERLDLHRQEAVRSGKYLPLVEYLLEKGEVMEAEEWIHKGIAAMECKGPYATRQLRSCLLDLRKKQNDWDAVLCMQTEDFVCHASLEQFTECRNSAEKLKVWPALYPLLMEFLIERKIPWTQVAWPCRNRGKQSVFKAKHPDFTTLIDLAIAEKNHADVLKWYDLQCTTLREYGHNAHKVANAVRDFAPERSVALWKSLAEEQIALVNAKAYTEAAGFLRKAGKLMREQGMTAEWEAYIQSLRHDHRRKTRLMDVLDGLSPDRKQAPLRQGRKK